MTISRKMRKQLDRLERCFFLLDLPMSRGAGASDKEIDRIEEISGITVDDDLRAMWAYSNGSGSQAWFVCDAEEHRKVLLDLVAEDEYDAETFGDSVFTLYSTDDVNKWWSLFKDIDEQNPNGWSTNAPDSFAPQKLDKRIGPQMLRHKGRLPFGTLWGLSDELLFDACPSNKGKYGQVLHYRHDPDMLTYVAASFGDFFDRSLHWMERIFSRNPDCARDVFKEDRFS